ncbi:bifunctional 2-C-methyl-D-erythritol 4-phosphate cytidylyltransferase/2-C-methyl-D-erythritol 2,4-cyclodiphosphate synthase [Ancylobacter terrae]|uniref:bifunctional 2-C-methyl-D-erythritol 4-phosphate cytidylyltransferase/2-C-methyl-D-erythritol 2,4-cyclodiphosphate synthase n=1 Tax=Ancylobacter sp. sgz301288 TaxID=3342077 RepID=UPI00385CA162
MRTDVIIVAAGRGHRAGEGLPKQYRRIGGDTVLARTLRAFAGREGIGTIQPVIHPDDAELYAQSCATITGLRPPVAGGATRQASVRAGLEALAGDPPDLVLIHDAARPFVSNALIQNAISAAAAHGAAVPVLAVTDTLKSIAPDGTLATGPDRAALRMVQTPQAFRFPLILDAHRAAAGGDLTDDAAVAAAAGHTVAAFAGEAGNVKLTTPEDFVNADNRLLADLGDVRTATGFDVHAFEPGDHVIVGGISIPHTAKLSGHSDADVVLHALTDAILGTIGSGDIGHHFPPSDAAWKGASSDRFLAYAVDLVRQAGGRVAYLDATVICEAPKIGPHREAMRAKIAEIAGIPVGRVSVKATTSEKLGFTGRREGIAALASATVRLPWTD